MKRWTIFVIAAVSFLVIYTAWAYLSGTASTTSVSPGSTVDTPVIANGLTATGSGSNNFSGSTGAFQTSSGTNTFNGVSIFTPPVRTSGVASYLTVNIPADTGQTASTESIGTQHVTGTRTWATTGTVGLQRENFWAGPTYASASASQTFTDVFTAYFTPPIAGTNAIFTRGHTLGIVDSTSAASSTTGGLIVATTLGTSATSVGIGGGNVIAGGSVKAATINATTGIQLNGNAVSNTTLRGNNTNYVVSTIPLGVVTATVDQTATAEAAHVVFTVGANTPSAGTTFRIVAWGNMDNGTTATTFTPRIRWGGTAGVQLIATPTVVGTTTAQTNLDWSAEALVTIRTTGATGTAVCHLSLENHEASTTGVFARDSADSGTTAVTIDTTANKDLDLTWQMSQNVGSPHVRTIGGYVECIN